MKRKAEFFKALGDETRLSIVEMLGEKEMCVCEMMEILGTSQPAVSHHLKILKYAGIVEDRREGKWIFYSLCQKEILEYLGFLLEIVRKNAEASKISDSTYCEKLREKMGFQELEEE